MERKEMKKLFLIGSVVLGFAFIGCDDISQPPKDPRAPLEELQGNNIAVETHPEVAITTQKMIAAYNLVVNTRNGLLKFYSQLEPLMQSKDPMFMVKRSEFIDWLNIQVKMLEIRDEELSPAAHGLGDDHPAASLWLAIRAEKNLIDYYVYHFQLQRPLPPELKELNKRMDDRLQEFQQKMQTWKGPPDKKQAPVLQQ